jgi:hypothetical protein
LNQPDDRDFFAGYARTLVGYRDGRVEIVKWSGSPNAGPDVAWTRQSLPAIVWNGQLNPDLNDSPDSNGPNGLVPHLVEPQPQQSATRYLTPDSRDFFAVYRPVPGPVTVPFK